MTDYLENVSVLIVDDHDFIRSLMREILKALGCQRIKDVSSGAAAWDMAAIFNPDIIITDWEMAPMNGLELTKRLRTDPNSPSPFVPIIMMTGYGEVERVIEARDYGVTEYIIKPLSAKAMFSRLFSVIENPRPFVRSDSYFGPDRRRRAIDVPEDRRRPVPSETQDELIEGSERSEERSVAIAS